MTGRILSLNLLVLLCTAFPAQAFRLMLVGRRPEVLFASALAATAALAWVVVPVEFRLPESPHWYGIAVGAGLVAPFLEYLLGAAMLRKFARIGRHVLAGSGWLAVLAVAVSATAEEVIFRGIALPLLAGLAGVAVAVGVTAVVYGLNHLYFGWTAVAQKTLTGVGLGLLFVWSGQVLLLVIIAHVVQNLVVQLAVPR